MVSERSIEHALEKANFYHIDVSEEEKKHFKKLVKYFDKKYNLDPVQSNYGNPLIKFIIKRDLKNDFFVRIWIIIEPEWRENSGLIKIAMSGEYKDLSPGGSYRKTADWERFRVRKFSPPDKLDKRIKKKVRKYIQKTSPKRAIKKNNPLAKGKSYLVKTKSGNVSWKRSYQKLMDHLKYKKNRSLSLSTFNLIKPLKTKSGNVSWKRSFIHLVKTYL